MKALKFSLLCVAMVAVSATATAKDARSIAMGNTGIITGKGVSGAMLNPALLQKHKDQGLKGSFRVGTTFGIEDRENIANDVENLDDVIDMLDREANNLENNATVTSNRNCTAVDSNSTANDAEVCVTGLTGIRTAATEAQNLLNNIDGKPLELDLAANLGFSYLDSSTPFAVNLSVDAVVINSLNVSDNDQSYFAGFTNQSADIDELTVADIKSNKNITIDENGDLSVDTDDDFEIDSSAEGVAVVNSEVALSFANDVEFLDDSLYVGITPKVVNSIASNVSIDADDDEINTDDLEDQIELNQVEATNLSADIGMLYIPSGGNGVSFGAVVTNLLPYSITTKATNNAPGYTVQTEAQAKVGVGYESKYFNIAAEGALHPAKDKGIETQEIGLGAEANLKWFGLRAGVSHDLAIDDSKDATGYSVGVDLGFIEIGAKIQGENSAEVSTQIAFDF